MNPLNIVRLLALTSACLVSSAVWPQTTRIDTPADPKIGAALKEISAQHVQATIARLVSFGNRSTLSAQDPASIATGRGIGAARDWIKSEFERYSKDCDGCLEVTVAGEEQGLLGSKHLAQDTLDHVDFDYVANVARLNAATLASIASAPSAPTNATVELANLDNDTTLSWDASPGASGYQVVWRATSSPQWEHAQRTGAVNQITLPISKDNVIFGVRALDTAGHASLPVIPVPPPRQPP